MKIVVIGYGFVGKAVSAVLSEKHTVHIIDPFVPTCLGGLHSLDSEPDGFVICVPTPQKDNGRCDDVLVSDYVWGIHKQYPDAHVLIKSTTSVETLGKFECLPKVTFSPEFLRGSNAVGNPTDEFRESDFVIFGGTDGRWWYEVFNQVLEINNVRFLDIQTAGFLKYTENAFLATKVTFFNEIAALYEKTIDRNYDGLIEALALDERIGMSHTQVPGPDGKKGWGGHCFPKDTSEFVEWSDKEGELLILLATARSLNKEQRDE